MNELINELGAYAPLIINVVKAFTFLIIGYLVAGMAGRIVRNRLSRIRRFDQTLVSFASSMVRWLILAFVGIAVLQLFGFQATSLVAVLGAASLAIGLALQGTLSDVASGVMLIIFRHYKMGDYVDIGGTAGTIKDINLFVTEMATPDNVQIIMPNSKAWGSIVTNYSAHPVRRCDFVFGIDYDDDMDKAMQVLLDLANADERVHQEPAPWVRVTNLGDSSVDLTVRLWCAAADYWELKFAFIKATKEAFDANGISIPYPHQVEVLKEAKGEAPQG
ncbi:mechanosensitive ion channel [Cohaesibacter sp. CAU 1516]|uniref:mechanosensitive ion channel family protein n=1 Tax=Cohaesibacter sp. CAU 1516 TaxID=2576038 RepID=UPI0010FD4D76|nr:mechanosensitive ion channel domain-containing protein [Cohaesibacter sp. CAU 1516]TLP45619.1 mechanosensitive ion channel [Cohaesibacter sp. CAU 1516]